jgi:hypothetical protein
MSVKKFTFQITKKGRKWFEGINEKGRKIQILINEVSNEWHEGQNVTFLGKEEVRRSKFGISVKIYPVPEEEGIKEIEEAKFKKANEEYEKWKGYIEDAKKKGYLYKKELKN